MVKTDDPLVSVIMNCYDGADYLEKAVKSVQSQTYKNWEIIFWDNKSRDNSLERIEKIKDSRIKIFRSEHHVTLNHARNLAIQEANGELIAFLDVDDLWDSAKLALQVPMFEDSKIGFVFSNFTVKNINELGEGVNAYDYSLPSGNISRQLFEGFVVGLLTLVIRRRSMGDFPWFDPSYSIIGDMILTRLMSLNGWLSLGEDRVLATYIKHESSTTAKNPWLYFEEIRDWLDKKKSIFMESEYKELYVKYYRKVMCYEFKFYLRKFRLISAVKILFSRSTDPKRKYSHRDFVIYISDGIRSAIKTYA